MTRTIKQTVCTLLILGSSVLPGHLCFCQTNGGTQALASTWDSISTGHSYVGIDLGLTGSAYIGSQNFLWGIVTATDPSYHIPSLATYLPFDNLGAGIGVLAGAKMGLALLNSLDIELKLRFMTNYSSKQESSSSILLDPANGTTAAASGTSQYSLLLSSLDAALLGHYRINNTIYAAAGFSSSFITKNGFSASQNISGSYVDLINHGRTNTLSSQATGETQLSDWFYGYRTDLQFGAGSVFHLANTNMLLDAELLVGIPLTRWLTNAADSSLNSTAKFWLQPTPITDPRLWYATLTVGLRLPFHTIPPPPPPAEPPPSPAKIPEGSPSTPSSGPQHLSDTTGNYYRLYGHVKDASTGLPMSAALTGVDLSNNQVFMQGHTDSVGNYSVRVKWPGKYSITAQAAGHIFGTADFEVDSEGRVLRSHADIELGGLTGGRTRMLVFFDFDKAEFKPSSMPELDRAVELMRDIPDMKVEIAGYSDSLGPMPHNLDLSLRRARAVRNYMIDHGISGSRISAKGHGPIPPIATNATDEGRAENRRVEFVVQEK